MTKKLIDKRYNRILNILLGIYVVLCLVFALLFNGFFVNPKALEIDNTFNVDVQVTYNGNSGIGGRSFSKQANNISRICIITDSDLISAFEDNNSIFTGGVVVAYRGVNIDNIPVSPNVGYPVYSLYDYQTSSVPSYLSDFDSSYDEYMHLIWFPAQYPESTLPNSKLIQQVIQNKSSIGYVKNLSDLKKYMKDGDNSVVKYRDPDDDVVLDNSLPVPQKVSITEVPVVAPYVPSGQNGASIQASWVNPNKFGDDDLQELCIQVKFSATYKAYSSILGIPKGKFSTPFTEIKTININNPNVNKMIDHYISYGINDIPFNIVIDSQGYNKTFTSFEDMALYTNVTDTFSSNGLNPFGYTPNHTVYELIKGTKFSIRYKLGDKVSYWVDVNYSGNNVTSNETTFSDNNNEEVDPEDVNYDYPANSINPNDNSLSIMNFFDKLSANIGSIFSSTNQYFDDAQQGTGSFFNFFKAFWDEFPAFFALLLLGLVIAILLRILGR